MAAAGGAKTRRTRRPAGSRRSTPRHERRVPDPLDLDRPLRGLRVVDTTDATSWSSARLLADLGADVIRVETPDRRVDALYATRNANKRSVVLDGRRRAPRAAVARRHLVRDRRHEPRRRRRPTARARSSWSSSISPFGQTGPYHDVRGDARGRLRAVRTASHLPAPRPSAAAAAGPARVRGCVRDGRVLRARRGVEPCRHRPRRPSRPLDPGGDDPDHRHAGGGRERAARRARRFRSPARRDRWLRASRRSRPPTASSGRWS